MQAESFTNTDNNEFSPLETRINDILHSVKAVKRGMHQLEMTFGDCDRESR
jgi:hypothetical protein